MKSNPVIVSVVICALMACSKNSENSVQLRVENNASQNFKEVFTNNITFKNVDTSSITSYKVMDKIIALANARIIKKNNDTAYVGLYYFDTPVSYINNGKYTLRIFDDTSAYYGYNCEYVED